MKLLALVTAALFLTSPAVADAPITLPLAPGVDAQPGYAPAGGTAIRMPYGSIYNIRDIHGGMPDEGNLDVGASNWVVINEDVGTCFVVKGGEIHPGRLVATICANKTDFYGRVVFHGPVHFARRPRAHIAH